MGGGDGGPDEMLVADGHVEGCNGAGDEEPSDIDPASAMVFFVGEA